MDGFLGSKWYAGGVSILTIGAVLWPVVRNWRESPEDDFPLSHYPMFSAKRPEKVRVTHLVGVDGDGRRYLVPYKYAGGGGMNQVRRQINRLVREGKADALCQTVAARISLEEEGRFTEVVNVQVITGKYRLSDYFSGNKEPLSEDIRASCPVRREIL